MVIILREDDDGRKQNIFRFKFNDPVHRKDDVHRG